MGVAAAAAPTVAAAAATVAAAAPADGVRGINVMSADWSCDTLAIAAAARDGLDHVQLSHRIVHSLCSVRDTATAELVRSLTRFAHERGIAQVCAWDHALYDTDYYPDRFKVPGTGLLDLDNPDFWEWMKQDYREMLALCPEIDGLVLTFVESGSRVEDNFSVMSVPERLAKVINTVSEVVCGESGKTLWLRTFAYNEEEYGNITACFNLVKWDDERMFLMVKDVPHDFFLYHPDNPYIGRLGHPTLVEFDACGEYNGQSVILNTLPYYFCERWSRYVRMPEVVGYVARTSRCVNDEITGTPAEINLYALRRASEEPGIDADRILDEFITERYGAKAVKHLKAAFKASRDIIEGTMYPLKLNATHHSDFRLDDPSTYGRHVSGRWTDSDSVWIGHGVDRQLHWWTDIVNTLSPAGCKRPGGNREREIAGVLEKGWLSDTEDMTEEYLDYVMEWQRDCRRGAVRGFRHLKRARRMLEADSYTQLYDLYERSLMCLDLRSAASVCFWGARIWDRGESFRTRSLARKMRRACRSMEKSLALYESYDKPYPAGTWDFKSDASAARSYYEHALEVL